MKVLANGSIRVPETGTDLAQMFDWISRQHTLALDTETSGLDIYAADHRLRLVALATPTEAWVFPWETYYKYLDEETCYRFLQAVISKKLIMHNASYDIPVLVRHGWRGVFTIEKWWARTRDTKILAHQVDPRGRDEGGIGQSLDELVKHYMPEFAKLGDDLKDEFLRLKADGTIPRRTSLSDMWSTIPIDNDMYQLYAGTDAILTARLFGILSKLVVPSSELTQFDHKVSMIASLMDAKGFLLDQDYTTKLQQDLLIQEHFYKTVAKSFGLENINSPQQVVEALASRGLFPDRLTAKGNPQVDKIFLNAHKDDPLVEAIIEGKKAGKWRTTWVEKFLGAADSAGRVHPSTNTLRARTARFSITGIPAQTLPSSDSLVRSCFVADTGESIVGVDYAQQELRFAAATAPDARMIKAFRNGEDLYVVLAESAWPGRGLEMRKYGKGALLTHLYGGGVRSMMDQWGMTPEQAGKAKASIEKTFPGLKKGAERHQAFARKHGYIETWTGRKLPVDSDRLYAATNYYGQSGCRDHTAGAMVRLYDEGYVDYMRLAIHDELLFSMPNDPELIREVERIMSFKVGPLDIPAQAKVGSKSWGSLYEGKN